MYITLTPYLTDYRTAKAAKAAWNSGADFAITCYGHPYDGKPINKSQADETFDKYSLRFCGKRKTCNV